MRLARRLYPVTGYRGNSFAVREDGRRMLTPLALALGAIVAADIAFAVDSIPAAFAITDDALVIWAANGFALLGLRALFTLVEELIRRFRYLNQTVAIVLGDGRGEAADRGPLQGPAGRQPGDRARAVRRRHRAVDPRRQARRWRGRRPAGRGCAAGDAAVTVAATPASGG